MESRNAPTRLLAFLERDIILQAPHYQRKFKWGPKELTDFWDDVNEIMKPEETSSLFLGAIILRLAQPSSASSAERWTIIDGQQRLTTLSLAILALCLECEVDAEMDSHLSRADGETFVTDVVAAFLVPHKSENRAQLDTRVMVTTPDLSAYRLAISKSKLSDHAKRYRGAADGNPKIGFALDFHRRHWRTLLGPTPTRADYQKRLDRFVDKVELVEIQLSDRHDPNEVFNRLNTSGTKLTIGDLIRNEAFENLSSNASEASEAYREHWEPFERLFSSDASRESYYWPFTLAVDPTATQKQALVKLKERWKSLYRSEDGHSTDAAISLIVGELTRYVDAYKLITERTPMEGLNPPVQEAALQLVRMGVPSVTYSFLMLLLHASRENQVSDSDAVRTLNVVESFLARRALIGQEPTGLHAVFKGLWRSSCGDPGKVRAGLRTQTVDIVSDAELREKLPKVKLYKRKRASYFLGEYERSIRRGGDPLTEQQLTTGIHVDHLAPQSMMDSWKDRYQLTEDGVETLFHSWGNLAPLSKEANSSKNAADWPTAKRKLKYELIYKSTQEVLDTPDWTPDTIRARTSMLTEWAISRWPYPSE